MGTAKNVGLNNSYDTMNTIIPGMFQVICPTLGQSLPLPNGTRDTPTPTHRCHHFNPVVHYQIVQSNSSVFGCRWTFITDALFDRNVVLLNQLSLLLPHEQLNCIIEKKSISLKGRTVAVGRPMSVILEGAAARCAKPTADNFLH